MLQPHGRYFFGCLPKLPSVLETHLRREGVLSSNGFIYCIPEAAPTILRWQHTFDIFGWLVSPSSLWKPLNNRSSFVWKSRFHVEDDDHLQNETFGNRNWRRLIKWWQVTRFFSQTPATSFRQIPQDWSFKWYNLAAASDTSIWIGAWESFEAWFCISRNCRNYGF